MTRIRSNISIITLNINSLNFLLRDTHWLNEKKNQVYAICNKLILSGKDTQTQNKGMEKDIPCKRKPEVSRNTYTYIKQILNKKYNRDKIMCNDKEINSAKGYKNSKYICNQHQRTQIDKTNVIRTEDSLQINYS